ncbi:MAG: UDP-N-acetylmuramoyl-L-alanine--D-glutamate ligase [Cellvibrionaceae bacterium]
MSDLIVSNKRYLVVGLGVTGQSVARYFSKTSNPFIVADTRENPPQLEQFKNDFPDVAVYTGELSSGLLEGVDEIIVSPGISLNLPVLQQAREQGISTVTDIEIFARHKNAQLIAITGSNGKSTVTTLVADMAKANGLNVGVGGNLGVPALELLADDIDTYVLELSSFQLEGVDELNADVACILNITPDHMDRYDNMQAYRNAKHRVFNGAKSVVYHRADPLTQPMMGAEFTSINFGLDKPQKNAFGLIQDGEQVFLSQNDLRLMACDKLRIKGEHNRLNALAALAISDLAGWNTDKSLEALAVFEGLEHRCQWIAEKDGIAFINDSKATNVGSTEAAIHGLTCDYERLVLIAGGEGKDQDFSPLQSLLSEAYLRSLVVMGRDAKQIAQFSSVAVETASTMNESVKVATGLALPGDAVVLSPACASFDMFESYEARGRAFVEAVEALS